MPHESPASSDPLSGTGIDTTVPHSARIWNYWLGGKDNYAVDRAAGDAWVAVDPSITVIARETRAFLGRTVRYLAGEARIRQFLDIGTGLPTVDNTHEVAQRVAPHARIVYVDNDPLVLAHARALLTSTPEGATQYLHADMHDHAQLIDGAAEILDFTEPIAVLFMGVLGHIPDIDQARSLISAVMDRVPSGSYLVLAEGIHPEKHPEAAPASAPASTQAQDEYADTGATPYRTRTPEEIASFFHGLDMIDPGVVSVPLWRPDQPSDVPTVNPAAPKAIDQIGGIARKA